MRDLLLKQQITLSDHQLDQFAQYKKLLIEKNKVMNLTAITDEREVYIKHFYDSLTISQVINLNEVTSLLDVGTGAGFPGIPLKIVFPHLRVVLLDSLKKRVQFLQEVIEHLGLTGMEAVHGRAEEMAQSKEYREKFDLVTSRAVAKLPVLAEYCIPFVHPKGKFIAMKGADITEEVTASKQALYLLGRVTCEVMPLTLPEQMGERHLLVMEKQQATPKKYPRKPSDIKKIPI
jgi:16S rRNA (guanine527-N7)-methyltransferase